jgi:hypothetical protein
LLFFNPLIEAYLPFATSLDEGTAKEFLEKEKSVFDDTSKMLDAFRKPNTGRNDDNANNEIAKKERKREEKRTRILSLIESLISWRLLARRQGAVDLVYRTGIPQFVPPAKMPVSAREYFEGGAILLPLRQDCSAQPDGVIGISWKDDKDNRAQQIKAHFENRDGSHAEWGDFRVLTEVFACVLALHRCSDEKLTDEFPPFVPNRE